MPNYNSNNWLPLLWWKLFHCKVIVINYFTTLHKRDFCYVKWSNDLFIGHLIQTTLKGTIRYKKEICCHFLIKTEFLLCKLEFAWIRLKFLWSNRFQQIFNDWFNVVLLNQCSMSGDHWALTNMFIRGTFCMCLPL